MISLIMNFSQLSVILWGFANNNILATVVFSLVFILSILFTIKSIRSVNREMERNDERAKTEETVKMYLINGALDPEYKKSVYYNPFNDLSRKSDFYFVRLGEKFPEMKVSELKNLIELYLA